MHLIWRVTSLGDSLSWDIVLIDGIAGWKSIYDFGGVEHSWCMLSTRSRFLMLP
jgi:hypothetical protein